MGKEEYEVLKTWLVFIFTKERNKIITKKDHNQSFWQKKVR